MGYLWGSSTSSTPVEKEKCVILACENYNDALRWVQAIQQSILQQTAAVNNQVDRKADTNATHHPPPTDVRLTEVEEWVRHSNWKVYVVVDGIRIFENNASAVGAGPRDSRQSHQQARSRCPPCLRINLGVSGNTGDVFMTVMNSPPGCRTGILKDLRIVESIDNCTDIIHVTLDPIYVYPTWTGNTTAFLTSE